MSRIGEQDRHRKDRDKQRQIPRQRAPARRQPYFGIGRQGSHSACPFGELLDASPNTIKDAVCATAVVSHATWMRGELPSAGGGVNLGFGFTGGGNVAGSEISWRLVAGTTTLAEASTRKTSRFPNHPERSP